MDTATITCMFCHRPIRGPQITAWFVMVDSISGSQHRVIGESAHPGCLARCRVRALSPSPPAEQVNCIICDKPGVDCYFSIVSGDTRIYYRWCHFFCLQEMLRQVGGLDVILLKMSVA